MIKPKIKYWQTLEQIEEGWIVPIDNYNSDKLSSDTKKTNE